MEENKKPLTEVLAELREAVQESEDRFKSNADSYWNSLTQDQKLMAFYSIVSRIVQAEMVEKRSYRGALYDVFGFGVESYMVGMMAGYMELHNAMYDAMEMREKKINRPLDT